MKEICGTKKCSKQKKHQGRKMLGREENFWTKENFWTEEIR
jgi:hypothetical protein